MRRVVGCLAAAFLVLSASVAFAATTASQLVELSRAGLDDEILIALIQSDGSTFQLTAADILALHRQGLSDRVIRAMQETARKPAPPPAAADTIPEAVADVPLAPPPPTVVNVYQTVTTAAPPPPSPANPVVYPVPVYVIAPVPQRPVQPAAPVYWGWGGQRRPDSWSDAPAPANPRDSKTPEKAKAGNQTPR